MTQSTTRGTPPGALTLLPPPEERRRLREAKPLTVRHLASLVGVTQSTLRAWETGRTVPGGRKGEHYARLLAGYAVEVAAEAIQDARMAASPDPRNGPIPPLSAKAGPGRHHRGAPDVGATTEVRAPADAPSPPAGPGPVPPPGQRFPTPEAAFDALYRFAAPDLARQTYLLTGRRDRARESVEHAFQLAWQHWPKVAVDRDPAGWVRAAAYEYATSPWHRLRRARPEPPVPAPCPVPDGDALHRALLALPTPYRRTLLLYDGLGLDLPDTAAETEASTRAAGHRVLHAREAVTALLPGPTGEHDLPARLHALTRAVPAPDTRPAAAVRGGGERRTRSWTRAALALTVLIVGLTGMTVVVAPEKYESPVAPPHRVGGVPVAAGPQRLTKEDVKLREALRTDPRGGPQRLAPRPR